MTRHDEYEGGQGQGGQLSLSVIRSIMTCLFEMSLLRHLNITLNCHVVHEYEEFSCQ